MVICGIQTRFDQPGYKLYVKLEHLLLKAANKEEFEEEFKFITNFYMDDFNENQLRLQLSVMSTNLPADPTPQTLISVLQFLRQLSDAQRALLSEVCTLASLILVMPATNVSSERSFSALRRVKSYLRATMTQTRLNNVMILHVHKQLTDQLNILELAMTLFESSHREALFRKSVQTDLSFLYYH